MGSLRACIPFCFVYRPVSSSASSCAAGSGHARVDHATAVRGAMAGTRDRANGDTCSLGPFFLVRDRWQGPCRMICFVCRKGFAPAAARSRSPRRATVSARSATRWPRTDDTAVPHRGDARDPGTQEASTAVRTISPTLSMEPVGPAGQRPLSAGTAASESSPYARSSYRWAHGVRVLRERGCAPRLSRLAGYGLPLRSKSVGCRGVVRIRAPRAAAWHRFSMSGLTQGV